MMGWIWLALFVACAIAELVTIGVVAGFIAVGAMAAALIAFFLPWSLPVQGLVFVLASMLGLLLVRPPLLRYTRRNPARLASGAEGMIGQTATVVGQIQGESGRGHVRIAGEDWPAISAGGLRITEGEQVIIVEIQGATLIVAPL